MRKLSVFLIILFSLFTLIVNGKGSDPYADRGILDLRDIKNPDKFIVTLNGEWEFYWGKMLRPFDFKSGNYKPDFYGKVPSYWTDYPQDSVSTDRYGYATYRLLVLLPEGYNYPMAIDLPVFDSSYDLYLNGKYFGSNGTPGTSKDETVPEYKRNFYRINQQSDSLDLIINISNYHHRRGGFWLPVKLGTFPETQRQIANIWASEWSVMSLLLGFSFFFLIFFILNPTEKLLGAFSLITIGLALRPLFTSHFLIYNIAGIKWLWVVRFEYLALFLVIIGWTWFVRYLYPSAFARAAAWIITVLFIFTSLLTLFLPVTIFSYFIHAYYPLMIVPMAYVLYKSFRGVLSRNGLDLVYFTC